jgi:hypothetical protein
MVANMADFNLSLRDRFPFWNLAAIAGYPPTRYIRIKTLRKIPAKVLSALGVKCKVLVNKDLKLNY